MKSFENDYVKINVDIIENKVSIKGFVKNPSNFKKMLILAPNPPDNITSFSGKNLPFPSEIVAYENTKNFKILDKSGNIDVVFEYPNSYYTPSATTKIISPIIVSLDGNESMFNLEDRYLLKTLTDRKRSDPFFYSTRELILPVGTAQQVMNNYAYAKLNYNIA
jgi:hypothetical protein